ncbi:MAG: aminotransferase class I/II-fold pyridoxal phosphate-dependent enzyme [Pseudomonadota bacterium]
MMDDHPPREPGRASADLLRPPAPASSSTPLVTPIWPSVVWCTPDADAMDAAYDGTAPGYTYTREGHPNATALARRIDALEGLPPEAGGGTMTGSGMGAITAILLGCLKAGDHVVASDQLYGRTARMMTLELPRLGIETTLVDATDGDAVWQAMRANTRMVVVEVVSNPTIRIADMAGIAAAARDAGALLVVDNTFTTPLGFPALARGADIVMHSVTKLLSGHSDVLLGWVGAKDPRVNQAIREAGETWGTTASPFDCWLGERGIATFALRHAQAQRNAAALAERLASLPGVEAVLYPGRADHPDHNRAAAVLSGQWGSMLSFRLRGGRREVNAFLNAAHEVPFAPTLGDVATTLSHPASSSHRALSEEARLALGITEGFIRMSVGVDDAGAVGDRLERAVAAATG